MTNTTEQVRQPWMHDMKPLVVAPAQLWSDADGAVDAREPHAGAASIAGFYVGDTRLISRIVPAVNGETPTALAWHSPGTGRSVTSMVARNVDGPTVDLQIRVDERRELARDALAERFVLRSNLDVDREIEFSVRLRFDMASMQEVKGGAPSAAARDGKVSVALEEGGRVARASYGDLVVAVAPTQADGAQGDEPASISVDGLEIGVVWRLSVPARGTADAGVHIAVSAPRNAVSAAHADCPWANVRVASADNRVADWVNASLRDLDGLRMSIPALPNDEFLAAGAPWFFTLFGRDSLWAARFMLPLTTRTAMGTLRTLAHFQATASDPQTNADPGKIMHELRAEPLVQAGAFDDGTALPPLYYGTIDATELWIILLAEAARWGAPESEVRALLPNLEAAMAWMRDWGDCDGDGFLEYIDRTGHGLSNQGWKDSGDSVRWNDGRIAEGPIALCEVQGYAYQAAVLGADLLERFGRPGAGEWREWAARLKTRFNEAFWVNDGQGRYPAIALDVNKKPVDSLTSNIGHLLGTGILDEDGVRDMVARLSGDDMLSGYGVRTMSSLAGGYWPQSYHCGSVWAHDSAIVMNGLRAEGYVDEALRVAEGLVAAAASFGYQIPELYSGDPAVDADGVAAGGPAAYPAACHPQAWSAASSVCVLALLLGLEPDVGAGADAPVDSPLARGLRLER
ncbi:MAG: glycogen debranching N-terminal domain-containing protein [Bifidobacterium scardovii]|nr:glycogen debranching N-terminal domain-containing protein [Bifidobacterium scardovii]